LGCGSRISVLHHLGGSGRAATTAAASHALGGGRSANLALANVWPASHRTKSFVGFGQSHALKCLLRRQTESQRDSVHPGLLLAYAFRRIVNFTITGENAPDERRWWWRGCPSRFLVLGGGGGLA